MPQFPTWLVVRDASFLGIGPEKWTGPHFATLQHGTFQLYKVSEEARFRVKIRDLVLTSGPRLLSNPAAKELALRLSTQEGSDNDDNIRDSGGVGTETAALPHADAVNGDTAQGECQALPAETSSAPTLGARDAKPSLPKRASTTADGSSSDPSGRPGCKTFYLIFGSSAERDYWCEELADFLPAENVEREGGGTYRRADSRESAYSSNQLHKRSGLEHGKLSSMRDAVKSDRILCQGVLLCSTLIKCQSNRISQHETEIVEKRSWFRRYFQLTCTGELECFAASMVACISLQCDNAQILLDEGPSLKLGSMSKRSMRSKSRIAKSFSLQQRLSGDTTTTLVEESCSVRSPIDRLISRSSSEPNQSASVAMSMATESSVGPEVLGGAAAPALDESQVLKEDSETDDTDSDFDDSDVDESGQSWSPRGEDEMTQHLKQYNSGDSLWSADAHDRRERDTSRTSFSSPLHSQSWRRNSNSFSRMAARSSVAEGIRSGTRSAFNLLSPSAYGNEQSSSSNNVLTGGGVAASPFYPFTISGEKVRRIPLFPYERSPFSYLSIFWPKVAFTNSLTVGAIDEQQRRMFTSWVREYLEFCHHEEARLRREMTEVARVLIKGWVMKRSSKRFSPWKRRFCVLLSSKELVLHKTDVGGRRSRVILLDKLTPDKIELVDNTHLSHAHVSKLVEVRFKKGKSLHLYPCDSSAEGSSEKWLHAFHELSTIRIPTGAASTAEDGAPQSITTGIRNKLAVFGRRTSQFSQKSESPILGTTDSSRHFFEDSGSGANKFSLDDDGEGKSVSASVGTPSPRAYANAPRSFASHLNSGSSFALENDDDDDDDDDDYEDDDCADQPSLAKYSSSLSSPSKIAIPPHRDIGGDASALLSPNSKRRELVRMFSMGSIPSAGRSSVESGGGIESHRGMPGSGSRSSSLDEGESAKMRQTGLQYRSHSSGDWMPQIGQMLQSDFGSARSRVIERSKWGRITGNLPIECLSLSPYSGKLLAEQLTGAKHANQGTMRRAATGKAAKSASPK